MRYPILALISIGNRPRKLELLEVKIDRFQIKQNVLNLKCTLQKMKKICIKCYKFALKMGNKKQIEDSRNKLYYCTN